MSCPPKTPDPCAQVCPPPPPAPPCINKPIMKGLHWAQTKRNIFTALILCSIGGSCVYFFIGVPRKRAYREYYAAGDRQLLTTEVIMFNCIYLNSMVSVTSLLLYLLDLSALLRLRRDMKTRRGEFEDWADEMARKGLFQAVPTESLKDNQHMAKK